MYTKARTYLSVAAKLCRLRPQRLRAYAPSRPTRKTPLNYLFEIFPADLFWLKRAFFWWERLLIGGVLLVSEAIRLP